MPLNWNKLRPWNGSQYIAFEELCCQLAASELPGLGAKFYRKGAPDAGVECFWRLSNGKEHGWQAKFFQSAPSPGQWTQLDNSVETALENHPQLARYTVCLPIDRSDSRPKRGTGSRKGPKSFLDKWQERVTKWKRAAARRKMSLDFEYWGEHEILLRLSHEQHRGRQWFWFDDQQFSLDWFRGRLREAIANAGDRYTPELNIALPIAEYFEALSRTRQSFEPMIELHKSFRRANSSLSFHLSKHPELDPESRVFESAARSLVERVDTALLDPSAYPWQDVSIPIDWDGLGKSVSATLGSCDKVLTKLRALQDEKKAAERTMDEPTRENAEPYREASYYLYELSRLLGDLGEICRGEKAQLTNRPALLLVGDAGQGKTHLLCDVGEQGLAAGRPRVLLHGGHFRNDEPWSQIVRELGLNCTQDEFLGALEAAAQAAKCRILILIDALNEGDGRDLWKKYLAGMLVTLARHPWVGLAVSVRSSYEDLAVENERVHDRFVRVKHFGFREHEFEAAQRFFGHFGIEPTLPLLLPEFSNPLFLKLLCQGVRNQGLSRIPIGLHGITALLSFFIDATNERLSKQDRLDYDPHKHYVRKSIEMLSAAMASRRSRMLPREEAVDLITSIYPTKGYTHSLFRHLISEGVLEEYRWAKDDGYEEIVGFTYERFGDHLIAEYLLDRYLDPKNPSGSFTSRRRLGQLCKDELSCRRNRGLIEALSIQLPERVGKELVALVPHAASFRSVRDAFVESIVWRSPKAFSHGSLEYINSQVMRCRQSFTDFFDACLTVAPIPQHPFNADRLHAHLRKFDMADRDAWWSTMVHDQWGSQKAVDRLVEWAWSVNDKASVPDEAFRLTGMAISWFLTSANRYLRDRATKALVRLFGSRISCLRDVLKAFSAVDEPFVQERLLAVAYGCALRSETPKAVGDLAQDVYNWIFRDANPPPSILLRDYARGVVEIALHMGQKLNIDAARVRPPYRSRWPGLKIPRPKDIESWKWKMGLPDREASRSKIYGAVMGDLLDEFSRYAIGDLSEWSRNRISRPHKPTRKERCEQFIKSLTPRQKRAWDAYRAALGLQEFLELEEAQQPIPTAEEKAMMMQQAEVNFLKTLKKGSKKALAFRGIVKPYLTQPQRYAAEENRFDGQVARRWMMGRIVELGWNVERFGDFDWNVNRYGHSDRRGVGSGRIGEKYQWIALHELLARLSDNFTLYEERWPQRIGSYDGPWQLRFRRDLDPSNLLRKVRTESWVDGHSTTWWSPVAYSAWDQASDHVSWLRRSADLPAVEPLIEVTNPEDGSRWFVIVISHDWYQPTPPGQERFEVPSRQIWYQIRSYLVRKKDTPNMFKWAKKQNFMSRWMPESPGGSSDIFLGEYFWSPAFRSLDIPYHGRDGWTQGWNDRIPAPVLVTTDRYYQESGSRDFSLDESIHVTLPCKLIADGMRLHWNGVEGHFFDDSGKLAAFDPSVLETGPGTLLIQRESFLEFLHSQEYRVIWTLLGQKRVISRHGAVRGDLVINGAFTVEAGEIKGTRSARYVPPPRTKGPRGTKPITFVTSGL